MGGYAMLLKPGSKIKLRETGEILTVSASAGGVIFTEEKENQAFSIREVEILKKKLICIVGKSGAGKSYIEDALTKYMSIGRKCVSHTTRSPREGEIDGVDYYYIDVEKFLKMKCDDLLLEDTVYNGWYYGLSRAELEKGISVVVANPHGLSQLKQKLGEDEIVSFFVYASDKTRLLRSLDREEDPDCLEIARRLLGDEEDFSGVERQVDHVIINDGRDDVFDQMLSKLFK